MNQVIWNRSLLFTAVFVAIVSGVSIWLDRSTSIDLVGRLSLVAVLPILAAASVSYFLRIVRFHFFLRQSGVPFSFRDTCVVQVIGFALSVTPGHVGEVFKLHLIRERSGTSVIQTAPLLVLDRVTEGGGFLVLALLSAIWLPSLRDKIPSAWLYVIALVVLFAFGLAQRWLKRNPILESKRLNESRIGQRILPHLAKLWYGLESSFKAYQIIGGVMLTAIARFSDGLVLLFVAQMLGVTLALPVAVFILAVSGLAGGISLLPAGTGAVEATMTGMLVLAGTDTPTAFAITLLARMATLWLWVLLGLAYAFISRVTLIRPAHQESNNQAAPE